MHAAGAVFPIVERFGLGLYVEIWPQYSAKAVFYVAQLRFTARLLAI
jgi:hypothetical protein